MSEMDVRRFPPVIFGDAAVQPGCAGCGEPITPGDDVCITIAWEIWTPERRVTLPYTLVHVGCRMDYYQRHKRSR